MKAIILLLAVLLQLSAVDAEKVKLDGGGGFDTSYLWGNPDNLVSHPDGSFEFVDPNGREFELVNIERVIVYEESIQNDQKIPLVITGRSANGRTVDYTPPVTYEIDPVEAGQVSGGFFVPTDNYRGIATIKAAATNRRGEPITGEIVIGVVDPPAVELVITTGEPVAK